MSQKAIVAGTLAVQDSSTGQSEMSFDLAKMFPAIDNLNQEGWQRQILSTPTTPVSLSLGGVSAIKGIFMYVESGTGELIFTHDANLHGVQGQAVGFYGAVSTPQVALAGVGPITVRYMVFG